MKTGRTKTAAGDARATVRQQVAAVCYRDGTRGIEFLLVKTRGGRWTFPKGGVEAGLTQAQSAALEAFEEAGVHGRIEEMPFARYRVGKAGGNKTHRKPRPTTAVTGETVTAHLCEVSHLEAPQESGRTPTWFLAGKARRRLIAGRDPEFGVELANVIDRAVSRIRRLETSADKEFQDDALRKVRFEAMESAQTRIPLLSAAVVRQLLIETRGTRSRLAADVEGSTALPARRKTNYIQ